MNTRRCWFYLRNSQGKESRCYHSRIHSSYPCEEPSIRADFVMLSTISVYFLLNLSRFLSTLQVPSFTRSLEGTLAFGDPRTQWIVACNRKLKTRTAVLLFVLGICLTSSAHVDVSFPNIGISERKAFGKLWWHDTYTHWQSIQLYNIYIYTGEETYHQCSYGDAILCNLELREYSWVLLLVDF